MPYQHGTLAAGGWQKFSLVEQLANIGSEVGRARRWRDEGGKRFDGAVRRALELFDLTIADERWRGRLKEICRAREFFCDAVEGGKDWGMTLEWLDQYFLQFAVAARADGAVNDITRT